MDEIVVLKLLDLVPNGARNRERKEGTNVDSQTLLPIKEVILQGFKNAADVKDHHGDKFSLSCCYRLRGKIDRFVQDAGQFWMVE